MKTTSPNHRNLEDMGPEVKSYVYQTILEFEPFTTPETVVTVIAKDRDKLMLEDSLHEAVGEKKNLWRIAITLAEGGSQIEEEGVHEDIYTAIRLAKDKLLHALTEIQDHIVSNQDRIIQINSALAGQQIH